MRRIALLLAFFAIAVAAPRRVRQPAVAGSFYPADPKALAAAVDGYISRASAPAPGAGLVALISPHAGYEFSGGVAARGYSLLKGLKFDRVVVIAPSHVESFPFAAVYDGDAYATPLGSIRVDRAFCSKLVAASPLLRSSSRGHAPLGSRGEHALEVQLPFLQRTLGSFKLVPIVMGEQTYDASRALGLGLARLIAANTPTLIVASSDLSHFHPYDDAVRLDRKTLNALHEWDYLSLSRNLQMNVWEACGGEPIVAAMIAAERLGAGEARVLKYANSGDATGDRRQVVGYGSVALLKRAASTASTPDFTLTAAEKTALLKLARQSVETAVRDHKLADPGSMPDALTQERGAFVTLKKRGELRGCIGYVSPLKPLAITVRDVAAFAALKDQRFTPVIPAELGELQYEISVLSPLRRVLDVKQIQTGKHGLVVRKRNYEGLLLPQVATEQHWDRMQFLRETCVKAGLPPDAWKDPDTDIFSFTALVF